MKEAVKLLNREPKIMIEIMPCTQGLFSDSGRARARKLIRKQSEVCKVFYASLEQRAYLDLNS